MKDSKLSVVLGWVAITSGAVLLTSSFFLPGDKIRIIGLFLGLGIAFFPAGIFIILSEYDYSTRLRVKIEDALNISTESLTNSIEGLKDSIQYLNKSKALGVVMVYKSREIALDRFFTHLEAYVSNPAIRNKKIVFIGSSLKGILETKDFGERMNLLLLNSLKKENQTEVRFLLTHPSYSRFREVQENRAESDIAKEIIHAIAWLEHRKVPKQNIKVYKGTPTCFMVASTERMIINPYPYEVEAFKCFCLEAINNKQPNSIYRTFFENHYLKPWEGLSEDRDHYKTPSALFYFHDYLNGPVFIESKAKRFSDNPLGDIFLVDDKGSFYIAINVFGLEKQILYSDETSSTKVINTGDILDIALLLRESNKWEKIGKLRIGDTRRGFWHDTLDNRALSAYRYIGLFDPDNSNNVSIDLPSNENYGLIMWKEIPLPSTEGNKGNRVVKKNTTPTEIDK